MIVLSIVVDRSLMFTSNSLKDINSWLNWMPLLMADHTIYSVVSDNGEWLSWVGDYAGKGELIFVNVENNTLIFEIVLLEPVVTKILVTYELSIVSVTQTLIVIKAINTSNFKVNSRDYLEIINSNLTMSLTSLKYYLEGENVIIPIKDRGEFLENGFGYIGIGIGIDCALADLRNEISTSFEEVRKIIGIKKRHSVFMQKVVVYKSFDSVRNRVKAVVGFVNDLKEATTSYFWVK